MVCITPAVLLCLVTLHGLLSGSDSGLRLAALNVFCRSRINAFPYGEMRLAIPAQGIGPTGDEPTGDEPAAVSARLLLQRGGLLLWLWPIMPIVKRVMLK